MLKKTVIAIFSLVFVALGHSIGQASEITFSGYTNGCFDGTPDCVPPNTSDPQSATLFGLTFNSGSFSGPSVGEKLDVNLGTFSLEATSGNDKFEGHEFNLRVSFELPTGIDGSPTSVYSSVLSGTVSDAPGQCNHNEPCGSVTLDFVNTAIPFTFTDGNTSGSFSFKVNDLTIDVLQSNVALTGNITLAQQATTTAVPVPEPASLVLLGTGLLGVARAARRRQMRRDV